MFWRPHIYIYNTVYIIYLYIYHISYIYIYLYIHRDKSEPGSAESLFLSRTTGLRYLFHVRSRLPFQCLGKNLG